MATQNSNTARVILVITGILLLTALGYFATKFFTAQNRIERELEPEIQGLQSEVEDLEADIIDLSATIERRDLELEEKDRLLAEREAQLATLESRLAQARRSGNASATELKKLENRLTLVRNQVANYEARISELESRVAQQRDTISRQRQLTAAQRSRIDSLRSTTDQQGAQLAEAARLQVADFEIYNVKRSGREQDDPPFRRGAMNELKVCFRVLENPVAEAGMRTIYLIVENPDGTVTVNPAGGFGGEMVINNTSRLYSSSQDFDYQKVDGQLCIPYQRPEEEKWEKGVHFVAVYAEGRRLGQTQFEVK